MDIIDQLNELRKEEDLEPKDYRQQKLERALTKINQAANEDRIKLETLKNCYITLATSYHNLSKICTVVGKNEHAGEWKSCQDGACPSNLEVLVKLELI